MDYSICIENISKQYPIGRLKHQPYATLREALASKCEQWIRLFQPQKKTTESIERALESSDTIWALKNVSFSARPGEVIGVVGKNGAGKSTLLKILSRITDPTEGTMRVRGRLASLLEVGTGFHPELTGRENVFLNGALLGMRKEEIRKKFDEIVAFSQIEKFIDTPVKRYSSGMYIRLAFSVAAHLDPDILVLDEVLAVGDLSFQKKCTGVMQNVASLNRTVLFVSHNLHLIRSLCSRVILIDQGRIVKDGPTEEVLPLFVKILQPTGQVAQANLKGRLCWGSGHVRIENLQLMDSNQRPSWVFGSDEPVGLEMDYSTLKSCPGLSVMVTIRNPLSGDIITTVKETITHQTIEANQKKKLTVVFPKLCLRPGEYSIEINLSNAEGDKIYDWVGQEADIPYLSVTSAEKDPQKRQGYFSIPALIKEVS